MAGSVVGLLAGGLALAVHAAGWSDGVEWTTLDARTRRLAEPSRARGDIALIVLDQASLDYFAEQGEVWPWKREFHAAVVSYLRRAGARAVLYDFLFSEPSSWSAEDDRTLAASLEGDMPVVLAALFHRGGEGATIPSRIEVVGPLRPPAFASVTGPLPEFLVAGAWPGAANFQPDADGVGRTAPLVVECRGKFYPSLPLAGALAAAGERRVAYDPDARRLSVGGVSVPVDETGRMRVLFHGAEATYPAYSMADVILSHGAILDGEEPILDPRLFRDKVVVVGATAAGLLDLRPSPLSPVAPGMQQHAAALDNLLTGEALREATPGLAIAVILVAALAAGWAGSLLSVGTGFLVSVSLAIGMVAFAAGAYDRYDLWLPLAAPEAGIILATVGAATLNYAVEGRLRRQVRAVFGRYVAEPVVAAILEDPDRAAQGGERREVTVFFSDLAGFTTLSEQLEPEALVQVLGEYLTEMSARILEEEGTLDKYIGDAVMAFWGAPVPRGDHALPACRAALANVASLHRLLPGFRARGYPDLHVRIGIHTGTAVVGTIGSDRFANFTAIGDTVNLAARLEGANKAYGSTVLISETTRDLAGDAIEVRELDVVRVKGKLRPVRVFELLALRGRLAEADRLRARRFEEGLVAYRARDWAEADQAFADVLAGRPGDAAADLYRRRVASLRADPPPDDWDGVYVMKTK